MYVLLPKVKFEEFGNKISVPLLYGEALYPVILLDPVNPSLFSILLAANTVAVVLSCVVIIDHHPPSKNGRYKLALIFGVEVLGINFNVPYLLLGSAIAPE